MYREGAGPDRSILVTAFGSQVFGLDRQSGNIRWVHNLGNHAPVELAIIDNVVVAIDSFVLAFLDYQTGQVLKSVKLAGEHAASRSVMLVDGAHVYVARHGEVCCYSSRGDLVWVQPFRGFGFGAIALGLPGNIRQADSIGSR